MTYSYNLVVGVFFDSLRESLEDLFHRSQGSIVKASMNDAPVSSVFILAELGPNLYKIHVSGKTLRVFFQVGSLERHDN